MKEEYDNEEFFESKSILPQKFLGIITRPGRLILDEKPYLTFVHFIEYVGEHIVSDFNLRAEGELPLVSKTRITLRDYQLTKNGWFVYTTMNLKSKIAFVEKIGELTGNHYICITKPEY